MPYILKGCNAFYEGWLTSILGYPKMNIGSDDKEAWICGWETAEETPLSMCLSVLPAEMERRHIIVEAVV